MKRTWMVFTIFVGVALILGCQDKITNTFDNDMFGDQYDARVIGTVHGIITAQGTGSPLPYVRVVYVVNGDTRTTYSNEDGYYRCEDLRVGTYQFTYFPSDTASFSAVSYVVTVNHDSSFVRPSQRDIYITLLRNVMLYRKNATVEGYINLRPNNDTTFYAAGAEVSIVFPTEVIPSVYRTVTTNPYGFYRFSNLPAVNYSISVRVESRTVNNVRFAPTSTSNFNVLYNDTVMAPILTQTPEVLTALQIINSSFLNRGAIPSSTVLFLDFNRPVADLGQITLTNVSQIPNVNVPTAVVVENNNTRVRIATSLSDTTNYRMYVRVRGVEDYSIFTSTLYFSTR